MTITITSVKDANQKTVDAGASSSTLKFPLTVEGKASKHHAIVVLVNDQFLTTAVSVENGGWSKQIGAGDVKKGASVTISAAEADILNTSARFALGN